MTSHQGFAQCLSFLWKALQHFRNLFCVCYRGCLGICWCLLTLVSVYSPRYKAGIPAPQGQDPTLHTPSSPLPRAERKSLGSLDASGAPGTAGHQPPPHHHVSTEGPTWTRAAPSAAAGEGPGSTWRPRLSPGSERPQGGSWLRGPPSSKEHPGGRREAARRPGITGCRRQICVVWEELIPG